MNIKKVLIIMMFPIAVNLIVGCCDCLETILFDYTNCSISIENLDNSGKEPIVSSSDSILIEAFWLRINIEREEDICDNYYQPLFITSAYARGCDCPPEELYQPLDSIISVKLITLRDFDSTHVANDFISEYFSVRRSTELISIEEFINSQIYNILDINNSNLNFDLMLMIPPKRGKEHLFEVQIELSDGRVLSETSNLIELIWIIKYQPLLSLYSSLVTLWGKVISRNSKDGHFIQMLAMLRPIKNWNLETQQII